MNANQQLGIIKRALCWALPNEKLLAYKTLCLPHLESIHQLLETRAAGKIYRRSKINQYDL